jgi:hypothetical protein
MNVEIGTETPIFLFWEYLFRNLVFVFAVCIRENGVLKKRATFFFELKCFVLVVLQVW